MTAPEAMAGGPGTVCYEARGALYLNVTNRCSNDCTFCVKQPDFRLWGYDLRLACEPTFAEMIAAIGDPSRFTEVVFCGLGEPTFRLDLIGPLARWLKSAGARRVRLNTNGHGSLLAGRDVCAELAACLDAVNVSLNAQDEATYDALCRPSPPGAYEAVVAFIGRCIEEGLQTSASVVDRPGVDEDACRKVAEELGAGFTVRGRS